MNARRLAIALVIALTVSGLFTFWLSRKVSKPHSAVQQQQKYVAAARELQVGDLIRTESLELVEWPTSMPVQGVFTKMEDIVGRAVLYPVGQGQLIRDKYISAAGAGSGITVKIPEGMRAISLRSDEVAGVDGFLLPGTHVDVLVTYKNGMTPQPMTATVLQDVQVLAAGHQIQPDPEGKPTAENVVTVLLKPEDAEKVVFASSQGTIHFVLRNNTDRGQVAQTPIGMEQLVHSTGPSRPAAVSKHLSPPKPYVVEVILGDKAGEQSNKNTANQGKAD